MLNYWNNYDQPLLNCFYSITSPTRSLQVIPVIQQRPQRCTETIRAVVQLADLVVVPTKPSPHDLRAVVGTMDLVDEYNKPVVFVINAAVVRVQLTGQVAVALSQ